MAQDKPEAADAPYDQVFEIKEINGEFGQIDAAIILGVYKGQTIE
ncbi:MAG: hypothetical protein ABI135_03390 [Rhodoferax sp.]